MAKKKERNYFNLLVIFVLILLALYILFNSYGVIKYLGLKEDIGELNREITETGKKIERMKKEIDSLNTSDYKIEKLAREKYYMKKPNEQVYSIEKDTIY